ncbi:hypothetical protein DPMN_017852 [Dreissena polymorpha]|uniref:Uncharacterized protein n=1 Tax=Dreissena polymorpha TaxID=45954 RepID=A0A9D4S8K9_DREPO|nr:hypothetical protein DPMN_017852 [Dreissena polymorpha]
MYGLGIDAKIRGLVVRAFAYEGKGRRFENHTGRVLKCRLHNHSFRHVVLIVHKAQEKTCMSKIWISKVGQGSVQMSRLLGVNTSCRKELPYACCPVGGCL